MIIIAVSALTILHPEIAFRDHFVAADFSFRHQPVENRDG